ncbi:unnamed protein product [Mytilus edulis]|uniref:DZIP3-like HEPN domain-containing protein n=1 Tax=Mytilus edulis TaxID=6550 RepID=A0A8S3VDM8_MYTED|nr:unnamed protein product [Mytilus edulis]
MSSQISEEESNYLKVVFVLLRIATPLVRVKFDNEVHPIQLKKELDRSRQKLQGFLNQEQMDLLFPKTGDPTSRTFDITLMILLIKNLTPIKISDVLPYPTHTNLGAHLSRIKFYRNMISHSEHGTIGNTYFAECWENIAMQIDNTVPSYVEMQLLLFYDKDRPNMIKHAAVLVDRRDDEDDFGASDDHNRLWSLFTDTGKQVLYHFVEIRIHDIHDETNTLHQFLDKHKNLFHQPCCPCGKQMFEDKPFDKPYETKCFPEYFNNINVSVENCPLDDLIGYLVKTGKCNEEEKNWFETIMHTTQAKTSWDDLEKIEYLAEPIRYKNIVQLQINTLKMVVEEYKSLYQKRKKEFLGRNEVKKKDSLIHFNKIEKIRVVAYMEKFENRSAIIKINRRKLENTEEWNVTISTVITAMSMENCGICIKVDNRESLVKLREKGSQSIAKANSERGDDLNVESELFEGDITTSEAYNSTILETIENTMVTQLESKKKNRTSKLWIQYITMVQILRKFIIAERTGDWNLHLDAISAMLPYLAASGHNLCVEAKGIGLDCPPI